MKEPHDKDKLPQYPGGETWVDKYDERLNPKSRFAWFTASLVWLRDHVLAAVIIAIVAIVAGIYIERWLPTTPPQSPANIPATTSARPVS